MPNSRAVFAAPSSSPKRITSTSGRRSVQLLSAFRCMTSLWPRKGFGVVNKVTMYLCQSAEAVVASDRPCVPKKTLGRLLPTSMTRQPCRSKCVTTSHSIKPLLPVTGFVGISTMTPSLFYLGPMGGAPTYRHALRKVRSFGY